ncbi:CMRF35-like molecule 7 isoform X2 [Manis javanica]|uniref:CMRF35-like molecule 7 isoform X2 n=1 Tax=Manis javanica TaxID=9974 RepID=UPI000813C26F
MWLPPALLLLSLPEFCFPGCFSIKGPRSVRGVEQGSVAVQCNYDSRWKTYRKWWCRGASWDYCKVLIQTAGTEEEVQRNRVSIRDNQTTYLLTVTMKDVRQDDTDTYWCGIQKTGIDLGARIRVTIDPGMALTAPEAASNGTEEFSGSYARTHYVLLVFVKVPFLLILVGAILWLKKPQWPPSNFSPDLLSKDTAP